MLKYLVAGSAMTILIAAMPDPAAAAKQSPSPSATSGVATEDLSAHRRRYRHTHRYYGYRGYYGAPYYAYEPAPYYYGPRYYYGPPAPFPFWPFW